MPEDHYEALDDYRALDPITAARDYVEAVRTYQCALRRAANYLDNALLSVAAVSRSPEDAFWLQFGEEVAIEVWQRER